MFKQAIVRTPSPSMINGLSSAVEPQQPDYDKALKQHQHYINALKDAGLEVHILPALEAFPDACFIEDQALLTEKVAILTRPGAPSRRDEVPLLKATINEFYREHQRVITEPGTLEAGDVMRVGNHFFIGLSERTNSEGANQLIHYLNEFDYSASMISLKEVLHLKTGVSALDDKHLLVTGEFINHPEFSSFKQLIIEEDEAYAANCIRVNNKVLIPDGYPKTERLLQDHGFDTLRVDTSEFRKLDGGLSCLSLRF